ncbi:MAG: endonuclease/exonuclease/phosphatase family protein [Acidobacteria bacterium]|nr:endonuclease/exonuclease/phosphatase family protein [Acidobacteriota bacterium]
MNFSGKIKTLQWNIGGGRTCSELSDPADPDSYIEDGLDSIIAILRRENPDVITLQETHESAGSSQAEIIAGALGLESWFNDSYDDSFMEAGCRIGQAVISRYPITNRIFVPFKNPGFRVRDEAGNEIRSINSGLSAATIELPDGVSIRIETFHMPAFHFFGVDLRSEAAGRVLQEVSGTIGQPGMPTIVQADFNLDFPSLKAALPDFFDGPLREIVQESPTNPKGKRLDHILYAGLKLETNKVIKDVRTDHYPLIAQFSW